LTRAPSDVHLGPVAEVDGKSLLGDVGNPSFTGLRKVCPSSAQNPKQASPGRERYRLLSTANRLLSVSAKLRTYGVAGEQNPPPNAYRDQDRKQDLTN